MSETTFQKRSLAEQVADSLSVTIDRQGWKAGRRLPPVRDLARQFDVSSFTAHSAIQLLAQRGVVGLQPRQGAFVRKGSQAQPAVQSPTRNQIGIVWPCLPDPNFTMDLDNWTSRILRAAELELHEAGYYTTVVGYLESPQFPERLQSVRAHLGGVLTFAGSKTGPVLDRLDQWDIPWITINPPFQGAVHNFVAADNQRDCARLASELVRAGVRRMWSLSSAFAPANSNMEKVLGLCEGFILAGVPIQGIKVITCGGFEEPAGYEIMRHQLQQSDPPQLVFASGDTLALGAIRACREWGLRVPEDVGVIGATGLRLAELSHPSLSVIAQPMEEMGRQAAHMLVEMAREGIRRMIARRVPGQFIQRESFALPNAVGRGLPRREGEVGQDPPYEHQATQPPPDVPAARATVGSA